MDLNEFLGMRDVVEVTPKEWMLEKVFTLINTEEDLKAYVDRAIAAKHCALDLETTGLDNRIQPDGTTVNDIVGYCMSYDGVEGVYVPVRHRGEHSKHNLDPKVTAKEIQRLCNKAITIYHNSPFDHEFLFGEGIEVGGHKSFEDTLILSYLRDSSGKKHGLKHLSHTYLEKDMIELKELFHEDVRDRDFSTLDATNRATLLYAGSDAICTWLLFDLFRTHKSVPRLVFNPETKKQVRTVELVPTEDPKATIYGEQKFIYAVEKSAVAATRWMERNRPHVDLEYLHRVQREVELYTAEICLEISDGFSKYGFAMRPSDVTSAVTLGQGLEHLQNQGHLKAKLNRTEKSGQVNTSGDEIEALAAKVGDTFPFINLIRTFRRLQKVDGTYLTPLMHNTDGYTDPTQPRNPSHILDDESTRFSFNGFRVDTGRFAASKGKVEFGYSGINVQSMPACYNRGKFASKRIIARPKGKGRRDVEFYPSFMKARNPDYLIHVYDGHFVLDPVANEERCIAKSCEGCPFQGQCTFDQEPLELDDGAYQKNTKILSLDSAVRPAIKAREGYMILAVDQSGVELRVAANLSKEPRWIDEFFRCSTCNHEFNEERNQSPSIAPPALCPQCGSDKIGDLHTLTTQIVYGDNILTKPDFKIYRQRSKGANFSVLYGGGGAAVARSTGVTNEEGSEIKEKMLSGLPKLNAWIKATHKQCKLDKQVRTGVGRIIRLPDIDNREKWIAAKAERNAVNGIIQGTATGDLTKYAMAKIYEHFKINGYLDVCRLMVCVHDELVFEIRKDMLDTLMPIIVDIMTELGRKLNWPVPLRCDAELGETFDVVYNWNEFHPYCPTEKAPAPVPRGLWNSIEFVSGMWYIDDEGNEVMPIPLQRGGETLEEVQARTISADDDLDETAQQGRGIVSYRNKKSAYKGGPLLTFRVKGNGLTPMDEAGELWVVRQMRTICDFSCEHDMATHTLRVESWDGAPLITQDIGWSVGPEALSMLTKFLGVRGDVISMAKASKVEA
jgi:DNA polymerase I-like protein with 3'-5' exonuclease and polymerase domains